jgi:hypothetical protein
MAFEEVDLDRLRRSYLRRVAERVGARELHDHEVTFLTQDLNVGPEFVPAEWRRMQEAVEAGSVRSETGVTGG